MKCLERKPRTSQEVQCTTGYCMNRVITLSSLLIPLGYTFWALVFALSVIALGNFFLTITIFRYISHGMLTHLLLCLTSVSLISSVLRLTKTMEAIEVVPASNLIKFFGELDVNKVIKADGFISGFADSPVSFTSQGADLTVKVVRDGRSNEKN